MSKQQIGKRGRGLHRAGALLAVAAAAGLFLWGQNNIITQEIAVRGAPPAFAGFRIVIISDIHAKEFGRGNARLLERVRAAAPDIIAITGDIIHRESQVETIVPLAQGLADIAPTYYVTGNHEWAAKCVQQVKESLRDCGVTVLENEYVLLEQQGEKIALLGAEDSNGYAGQKTIVQLADEVRAAEGDDCYQLLLCHRNDRTEEYEAAGVDLTLSGHAHGGLIRLPGTDGLFGHGEFLPDYTAGLYQLETGQLVVSRGLGNQPPTFRVANRPHLPVVILDDKPLS